MRATMLISTGLLLAVALLTNADTSAAPVPAPATDAAIGAAPAVAPESASVRGGSADAWHAIDREFTTGKLQRLEVRVSAGAVRIVPGRVGHLRVRGRASGADEGATPADLRFAAAGDRGRLEIEAGDELDVVVEVPPAVDLQVRMSAGRLEIDTVQGRKHVRLYTGLVVLKGADADSPPELDLQVTTGKIEWERAGVMRGGIFRAYRREGREEEAVRVRLIAGAVEIV